jgi:hypothetical protein
MATDMASRAVLSSLGQRLMRRSGMPLSRSSDGVSRLLRRAESRQKHSAAWSGDLGSVAPSAFEDFASAMTDRSLSNVITPKFQREELDLDALKALDMPLATGPAETAPTSAQEVFAAPIAPMPRLRAEARPPQATMSPPADRASAPAALAHTPQDVRAPSASASASDARPRALVQQTPDVQRTSVSPKVASTPRPSRSRVRRFARIEERGASDYAGVSSLSLEEAASRLAQYSSVEPEAETSEASLQDEAQSAGAPTAQHAAEPEPAAQAPASAQSLQRMSQKQASTGTDRPMPHAQAALPEPTTHLQLRTDDDPAMLAAHAADSAVTLAGSAEPVHQPQTAEAKSASGSEQVESETLRAERLPARVIEDTSRVPTQSALPGHIMAESAAPHHPQGPVVPKDDPGLIQRSLLPEVTPPLLNQAISMGHALSGATQPDADTGSEWTNEDGAIESDTSVDMPLGQSLPAGGMASQVEGAMPKWPGAPAHVPAWPNTRGARAFLGAPGHEVLDATGDLQGGLNAGLSNAQATAASAWGTASQMPGRAMAFTRDLPLAKMARAQTQAVRASATNVADVVGSLGSQALKTANASAVAARGVFTTAQGGLAQASDPAEMILGGRSISSALDDVGAPVGDVTSTVSQAVGAVAPPKADLHVLARQVYPYLKRLLAVERERSRGF